MTNPIISWVEKLCGQTPQPCEYIKQIDGHPAFPTIGIGHSQLNELLLSLQLDRMSRDFFTYVFREDVVKTFDDFTKFVIEFRITAVLKYGNIKFAYKRLSQMSKHQIEDELGRDDPEKIRQQFATRHEPFVAIKRIEPKDTYYLGYIVDGELKGKRIQLQADGKSTEDIDKLEQHLKDVRDRGKFNHHCYLDYDHLDVYVATSMRERSDFWNVSRFVNEVFNKPEIADLKVRYFDPTQAYCEHRIDKGLSEALMLKRAHCAIYMAGEADTLGKDSELAATLAQGKPVIAYVPFLSDYNRFRKEIVDVMLEEIYKGDEQISLALRFLQTFSPKIAWEGDQARVRAWLDKRETPDFDTILQLVFERAKKLYDDRARTLLETHPLGLQVNLDTGVGNGVLVARDIGQCTHLLRGILLNSLAFELDEQPAQGAVYLRESVTKSVYRVITHDQHLTNSFWNFYLKG
jgi:hypothetical protein